MCFSHYQQDFLLSPHYLTSRDYAILLIVEIWWYFKSRWVCVKDKSLICAVTELCLCVILHQRHIFTDNLIREWNQNKKWTFPFLFIFYNFQVLTNETVMFVLEISLTWTHHINNIIKTAPTPLLSTLTPQYVQCWHFSFQLDSPP